MMVCGAYCGEDMEGEPRDGWVPAHRACMLYWINLKDLESMMKPLNDLVRGSFDHFWIRDWVLELAWAWDRDLRYDSRFMAAVRYGALNELERPMLISEPRSAVEKIGALRALEGL